MTFTSEIFLIGLFPWFIIIYQIFKKHLNIRKLLIFLANCLFYIWGGVGAFFITISICLISWILCSLCFKYKSKKLFTISCIILVMPLLTIKYTGFLINNINTFFNFDLSTSSILVPIGISFFTFQAISCISDIYHEKVNEKVSLLDMFLYLMFFPTVISGPIIRISTFKKGYEGNIDVAACNTGLNRFMIGLCKKVLIADKIAILADYYFIGVELGNSYSVLGLWIGSIAFTLQLYFDFSGYCDMAIGIGLLLGFHIPENFNSPYQASSIQDFWRRWHISLSQWFRDYIYIPLKGNRCCVTKQIRNLLCVWLLTGIWHGSKWTFIIWGLGYFLLIIAEKYIPFMKKIGEHWYGHIYAIFFINLLWIPFRASNMSVAMKYIGGMFGISARSNALEEIAIRFLPFMIFVIILCFPLHKLFAKFENFFFAQFMKRVFFIILVALCLCAILNSSYSPYLYGNF